MSCILNIETSTNVCSVSVSENGACIFNQEDHTGPNHNERLGKFVDEALSFAESHAIPLDAVAVSCGPGSYTGLRIGTSMAKGVCYGSDAQLISVPTLELLCVPVLLGDKIKATSWVDGKEEQLVEELTDEALLCPMIDARRMEVFAAVYDRSLKTVRGAQADIVDADTYRELLDKNIVYFFGNGALKCREQINHPNARYISGVVPLAKNMLPLADKRFHLGKTENVAYFTPQYLKEYQAKKSRDLLNRG